MRGLQIIESLATLEVPAAGRLNVRIGIATGMVVVSTTERRAVGETGSRCRPAHVLDRTRSPKRGNDAARTFLLDLAQFVEIAPTTTESLRQAGRLRLRDFEDAMQVAAAMACGADLIATRSHQDYAGAPIRAAAPGEVLKILG